jgi:iron(III)-enterobactin esterase
MLQLGKEIDHMVRSFSRWALFIGALVGGACSPSASDPVGTGTGGQAPSGSGGALASGGAMGSGGTIGSGGIIGSGGAVGTGGSATGPVGPGQGGSGTGGSTPTGGTGGSPAGSGGIAPTGGRGAGSGGVAPSGGNSGSTDPGTVGDGDFTVGPTFTPSPDGSLKAGAPAGFRVSFTLTSAASTIFNGSDFTPPLTFSRTITVFVPQQYVDGTESPFMVSSDGFYAGLQTVVQNLAGDPNPDHHVPALVIIGIQNGPDVRPSSERSLEYDDVSDRYWRFVTKEVIPAVLANTALKAKFPNFKLTSDPNGRGGYGCSSGGPAVMGLAWFGDFNRVFSFSGSFTALHPNALHPFGAWEYTKMITDAPLRPDLRVFQEVGQNDNGAGTADAQHRNWVTSNQNMAAALKAKGNHNRFVYATGAGHCDSNARNQVMPEGLIWLWRGYKAK